MRFEHENLTQRICFGSGSARTLLAAEVERLAAERVMLIASAREAERAGSITAGLPIAHRHSEVRMHVPVEAAEHARACAARHDVDALVCIGGGSAIGLAKAVALATGLPIIAVPTTYAGSEATTVWGMTDNGRKTTGVDARVLPRAIVYDAELTLSLPVAMSVASGLNALAHCVDGMWGPRADPIDQALAVEGIRALWIGLPAVAANSRDLAGREHVLYAAYLSAAAFSSAGSGLHHKICHVLGGAYNLPHAQTHAVVLPYVLAYNAPAVPHIQRRIAAALGASDALDGLQRLRRQLDAPKALSDYGFRESDIDEAVAAILPGVPDNNPRQVTAEDLGHVLRAACRGSDPATISQPIESQP
ncbi:maleylacetate reductase [Skermania sp. ID1734]|nr:maleylacetate reductase [Skermania sp. ID1734]